MSVWRICMCLLNVPLPTLLLALFHGYQLFPLSSLLDLEGLPLHGYFFLLNESSKIIHRVHLFLCNCRQLLLRLHCLSPSLHGEFMPSVFGVWLLSDQVHCSKINLSLKKYIIVLQFSPVS